VISTPSFVNEPPSSLRNKSCRVVQFTADTTPYILDLIKLTVDTTHYIWRAHGVYCKHGPLHIGTL
jgi:hypothetical protein